MVPTFLTNLALGTITNMVATILTLATWVTGSVILQGNVFFDTTNNATPSILINQQSVVTLQADGDVQLGSGNLVFDEDRNSTPLLVDGTKAFYGTDRRALVAPAVSPGTYSAGALNPFTGTGYVTDWKLLCSGTPNTATLTVSVATSATASGTTALDRVSASTGSYRRSSGTLIQVPVTQYLTAVSTSGSTAGKQVPDCDLIPTWLEL